MDLGRIVGIPQQTGSRDISLNFGVKKENPIKYFLKNNRSKQTLDRIQDNGLWLTLLVLQE